LKPDEFIRRFLLHTLPDGFHRIRHFGFLANGHRAAKLALARAFLKITSETEPADAASAANESAHQPTTDRDAPTCPMCGGIVRVTTYLSASSEHLASAAAIFRCDTS
ncbi:MAG: transposase, partial [Microvirga sp.]